MLEYEVVRSAERLPAIAVEIENAESMSIDLETTGLDPHTSEIRICSINTGRGVYVIDLFETKGLGPVVTALRDSKGVKIGQNLKFDQKFLLVKYNLELRPIFDTYRASALIHNGRKIGSNLYDLYARELSMAPQAQDLGGSDWTGSLTNEQLEYAAEDVVFLPSLREKLKPQLAAAGLNRVALIEFQAILAEASIETNGFFLDKEAWKKLALENGEKRDKLRKELLSVLPSPKNQMALPGFEPDFNLDSTQQLLESLHRLNIKVADTKEDTLAMIAGKYPDIIPKIIEYRGVSQSVKTFGVDYLEHINPVTGRIHTGFFPFTGAGRYSSSKPNLQQIPRDKRFRKCFRAAPGKIFVIADYSQIELRIIAEITGDPTLMSVYQKGLDAHAMTASIIAAKKLEDVSKEERQQAKPVNFGLIYGLMPPRLVVYAQANYGVSMTLAQAKRFWERYFEGYSHIRAWHERALRDGKRTHESRTLSGRRRYLEDESIHNEFYNTPVQGTGADGLKASLYLVYEALKKYSGRAGMVHMVHDEIIIECDDDKELVASVKKDLTACMVAGISPFLKRVPVEAEANSCYTWAEK